MSIESYGKYQLLKRLAMGGMAQIYLARARGNEKQLLVIKRILPHLADNDEFVQMFLDEARIAARLHHPHIVQIFDLGAQDDSFFIAMEYIHGEDLRRIWKRAERSGQLIPVPLVCRVLSEACAGLDHAHKKADAHGKPLNIVHRDISPQNILLTFDGRTKVVDFGIAKAADQATETRSGVLKGKYSYMSPEQAAGQKVDRRSDIFALGVVLYELLTGTRLFKRANDIVTLQAVSECKIIPPSQVNPRVPRDLDPIVMKALARSPGDRYAEAEQLQWALEAWLDAHPQPSAPSDVAAYMADLYATRLAEEARLGDVLVEESDGLSPPKAPEPDRDRADTMAAPPRDTDVPTKRPHRPSLSGQRPSLERKRTVDLRRAPAEPTLNASESGALSATPLMRPGPLSPPGETARGSPLRLALVGVGIATLVGLLLGGAWALRSEGPASGPREPVAAQTSPSEATPPEEAPAQAPPSKAPPTETPAGAEARRPEPTPEPAPVRVTLRATPGDAALTVDGKAYERSPVELSATPGQVLRVVARAPRHQELTQKVTVGQGPSQEESLRLKPVAEPSTAQVQTPPRVATPPPERTPARGTVRFAVTPWAEVSCGGRNLGTTPMPNVSLNAGLYECRFVNPDSGIRTKRVEVKPNALTTVVVTF